jgi:hypothetical protein
MEAPNFSNNLLPGEGKARKLNKLTRWECAYYFSGALR